jgi:hypothetical protein
VDVTDDFPGNTDDFPGNDDILDAVPVADAVEQQRPAAEPRPDDDVAIDTPSDVPLEAAGADWQHQHETVDLDPEEDPIDHDRP